MSEDLGLSTSKRNAILAMLHLDLHVGLPARARQITFDVLVKHGREMYAAGLAGHPQSDAPIDMVLFCPNCGMKHVDGLEEHDEAKAYTSPPTPWTNPPHRSHLCKGCGTIWRPADVCTNGVEAIRTMGDNDTYPVRVKVPPLWVRRVEHAAGSAKLHFTRPLTPLEAAELLDTVNNALAKAPKP